MVLVLCSLSIQIHCTEEWGGWWLLDLGEINVNTLCDIDFDCLQRTFPIKINNIIKLGGRMLRAFCRFPR